MTSWISQEEMEQRIRWLRRREGVNGATLSAPILDGFIVPLEAGEACLVCGRALSYEQWRRAAPTCSRACGAIYQWRRRRSA